MYRVEEMEITELIRRKRHTFHARGSLSDADLIAFELDPFGGNIFLEIALGSWFRSCFTSHFNLEISHDGCQSSQIHCDGDVMIVTVSAHNKNGCLLDNTCCKYAMPVNIRLIRVREHIV